MSDVDVVRITGAGPTDLIYSVDVPGEGEVTWNVTRIWAAAERGELGPPRAGSFDGMPPPNYENLDRAKIEGIKRNPRALTLPAVVIGARDGTLLTFADGNHRTTARREKGMAGFLYFLVPNDREKEFRVVMHIAMRSVVTS